MKSVNVQGVDLKGDGESALSRELWELWSKVRHTR